MAHRLGLAEAFLQRRNVDYERIAAFGKSQELMMRDVFGKREEIPAACACRKRGRKWLAAVWTFPLVVMLQSG